MHKNIDIVCKICFFYNMLHYVLNVTFVPPVHVQVICQLQVGFGSTIAREFEPRKN